MPCIASPEHPNSAHSVIKGVLPVACAAGLDEGLGEERVTEPRLAAPERDREVFVVPLVEVE